MRWMGIPTSLRPNGTSLHGRGGLPSVGVYGYWYSAGFPPAFPQGRRTRPRVVPDATIHANRCTGAFYHPAPPFLGKRGAEKKTAIDPNAMKPSQTPASHFDAAARQASFAPGAPPDNARHRPALSRSSSLKGDRRRKALRLLRGRPRRKERPKRRASTQRRALKGRTDRKRKIAISRKSVTTLNLHQRAS